MGKKIMAIVLGILTLITAWSTIKMITAIAHIEKGTEISYAPIPVQVQDPNLAVVLVSSLIYACITIVLALITIKLMKKKN
ncbi:hypothetical protein [Staphylococcus canis]|uniref:DUF4321 domain-containing protein n=1 Tax=Staphylococcus canis TaxID=2724942 RepID=A0ABS0T8I6_9STAP|nr:hypothetical protein [Staphylococcus canis]MBI5975071.1 hypothetical protein [Staphylococcus canis]